MSSRTQSIMTPGSAAAALADFQPLVHLKHANYQLREENRLLRAQVHELLEWKERAVRHMVTQAPKRSRAQRQLRDATRLQLKLRAVEQTLQEREELEVSAQALQQDHEALSRRVEALESENITLKKRAEHSRAMAARSRDQLRGLGNMFRVHLEKLVAVRESIDIGAAPVDPNETAMTAATTSLGHGDGGGDGASSTRDADNATDEGGGDGALPASPDSRDQEASVASLVAGLAAVSDKCLSWFEEHVAASFQRQQQKAALFETQHEELLKLRAQLHATRSTASPSASTLAIENQQQALEIARLQQEAQQLGGQRVASERALATAARAHRELTDRVRALAREVRQFLRLVRAEIRRKFGYVPEAIAHAESWARIAEALNALLRTGGGSQIAADLKV